MYILRRLRSDEKENNKRERQLRPPPHVQPAKHPKDTQRAMLMRNFVHTRIIQAKELPSLICTYDEVLLLSTKTNIKNVSGRNNLNHDNYCFTILCSSGNFEILSSFYRLLLLYYYVLAIVAFQESKKEENKVKTTPTMLVEEKVGRCGYNYYFFSSTLCNSHRTQGLN